MSSLPLRLLSEGDLLPVGRPDRKAIEPPLAGQVPQSAAVRVDDEDIEVVGSGGADEGDRPVGQPGKNRVVRREARQLPLSFPFASMT